MFAGKALRAHPDAMGVTFQREPVATLWPELDTLAAEHWREVSWEPGSSALLDHERYEHGEASGVYHMITARNDETGALIGYAGFWITTNPQNKTSKEASQDCIFVAPQSRLGTLGTDLIKVADNYLSGQGCRVVYHHVRKARDWSPVLRMLGYQEIERTYARIIGE
jgi:hypothetical protein